MAFLITPITINNTTPAVIISTGSNLTYQQIQNSLGSDVYWANEVYIWADIYQQVTGVAQFNHYDANGEQRFVSLTPVFDPYQQQPALYYDLNKFKVIIDGNSGIKFNLLPNVYLQLTFYCKRLSNRQMLDLNNIDNFRQLEESEGIPNFFEDYNRMLP